jgi:hypothetical protein
MKKLGKKIALVAATFVLHAVWAADLLAQCPMCRMTAESNMKNGGTSGAGLNTGILYMLVAPYLIVGGIAFWWWRNRKQTNDDSSTPADLLRVEDPAKLN